MDERVATLDDPRELGKNLVGPKLGAYWRYRVGDIRVICSIQDGECVCWSSRLVIAEKCIGRQ